MCAEEAGRSAEHTEEGMAHAMAAVCVTPGMHREGMHTSGAEEAL